MTDKIIPSIILSVKILHHHMIFFFESHCNTIRNFISIYQEIFYVGVFKDVLYRQVNSVDKSYTSLYYLNFFIFYFSTAIINGKILFVFTDSYL
jgi:hypothetical protein